MKCILRGYGINMTIQERQIARTQASDMVIARGTGRVPGAPRDLFVQSGPRGILLNWRPPATNVDVSGYRVYKDDENSLFAELRDPGATQHFIETTAGASPPTVNLFISSIGKLGTESPKVQIQGTATVEAGAPSMPSTPPTYTNQFNPGKTVYNPRQDQGL